MDIEQPYIDIAYARLSAVAVPTIEVKVEKPIIEQNVTEITGSMIPKSTVTTSEVPVIKKRGRPKGSKNKPKPSSLGPDLFQEEMEKAYNESI